MKKVLFLFVVVLAGCSYMDLSLPEEMTVAEILEEVGKIDYSYDWDSENPHLEYWQSPTETEELGTGDCEDFAIYFMYLANYYFGWEPELVLVKLSGLGLHYYAEYDGIIYDWRYQFKVGEHPIEHTEILRYDYDYVMFWATMGGTRKLTVSEIDS